MPTWQCLLTVYLNQTNLFFHQLPQNKTNDNMSRVCVLYKSRTSNCSAWLRTIPCPANEQITFSRGSITCLNMDYLTRIIVLLTFYNLYQYYFFQKVPHPWVHCLLQMLKILPSTSGTVSISIIQMPAILTTKTWMLNSLPIILIMPALSVNPL